MHWLRPCRIGKQFELTLLLQSVVMIITMFAMLHLCCTVQNTNRVSTKQHRLSGNQLCAETVLIYNSHNKQQLTQQHNHCHVYTVITSNFSVVVSSLECFNSFFLPKEGAIGKAYMARLLFSKCLISDNHSLTTNLILIFLILY